MELQLRSTKPFFESRVAVARFVERLLDRLEARHAEAKKTGCELRWTMTINSETGGALSVDCYAAVGTPAATEDWAV